MNLWKCIAWLWLASLGGALAQAGGPAEVVKSADLAVRALGDQIVQGHHEVAVESMYPQWKERMAKRSGGMAKMEESLKNLGALMARNGIRIVSVKTYGHPDCHEVWPGKGADQATVYTKWLVLVPTVTRMSVLREGTQTPILIDSYGFQVAIADKDQMNWKFINGSEVSVADLRSMFTSLPANLELPEVRREEAK
ncbi:hypothetical protein HNR46_003999 [Haloferula luteola]|uniref:Uncharacterized protein n=1 Tax=Haloferula luteola TaxID=595692 RepID=A0A840VGL9_9BACT|nr:hypothetical protein [Haloferula luteola]MBB5353738.1 hypothetical protein [Haloferula luteola]